MNDCASDRPDAANDRGAWDDVRGSTSPFAAVGLGLAGLIGNSPIMQGLYDQIRRVAPTRANVLIVGESGSGKEVVARALHDQSARADRPFVAVNCGAIPASLIEAELFGYERGSFTGAVRAHAGYFERAADGTLLLDEITEMPLEMQAKLLRVLESGQLLRVGGSKDVDIQCRVVAATNRDPQVAVAEGRLRADLLYRLAVFPLRVPALRERDGDAVALALSFLQQLNAEEQADKSLSADSLDFAAQYGWPGNVRELRNAVQRAFILGDDTLDLRAALVPVTAGSLYSSGAHELFDPEDTERLDVSVGMTLAEVEHAMVVATLKRCGGNKTRTAAMLGVSLKTLYNRLNEYRAASIALLTPQKSAAPAHYAAAAGT